MLAALVLAAAVSAADAAPPRTSAVQVRQRPCPPAQLLRTQDALGGAPRKLGELPPGMLVHTVDKRVAGCAVNVLTRRDASGRKIEVPAGSGKPQTLPAARRRR